MEHVELSISQILSKAWELSKKHGFVIAAVLFVVTLIYQVICLSAFPAHEYMDAIQHDDPELLFALYSGFLVKYIKLSLLCGILYALFFGGILNIVLKLTKGEMHEFNLSGFKMPVQTYVNFILIGIIVGIFSTIGTIMCIIPGIYVYIRLSLAMIHVLEHPEDGLSETLKKSWNMTKGNFWNIFLLALLYVLFYYLGIFCCCIGAFFSMALGSFMIVVTYLTLDAHKETI